ncbi:MAG TPA: sigma-70 family RNA polymerase sigma factor [Candidatus Paceibacterota bacterium]
MLEDEKKIIRKAREGEANAFGLLYDHYLERIYRFVLLKVSHREEAEDLTHLAFLKAWERIGEYQDQGFPFGSWLYKIARNTIIDHYRSSNGRKTEITLDYSLEIIPSEDDHLDKSVDNAIEIQTVMDAIKKLKPIEQDVVIMRFIDEMSNEEVADAVGKTIGAVKLIQHRALRKIKQELK